MFLEGQDILKQFLKIPDASLSKCLRILWGCFAGGVYGWPPLTILSQASAVYFQNIFISSLQLPNRAGVIL